MTTTPSDPAFFEGDCPHCGADYDGESCPFCGAYAAAFDSREKRVFDEYCERFRRGLVWERVRDWGAAEVLDRASDVASAVKGVAGAD